MRSEQGNPDLIPDFEVYIGGGQPPINAIAQVWVSASGAEGAPPRSVRPDRTRYGGRRSTRHLPSLPLPCNAAVAHRYCFARWLLRKGSALGSGQWAVGGWRRVRQAEGAG